MSRGSEAEDYSGLEYPSKKEKPSLKLIEPPKKEKNKWTTGQRVRAGFGIAIAAGASTIATLEALEGLGVDGPVIAKYIELKTLGIETSNELADKFTKATGIKIFGAEEKQAGSEVKGAFTGLEIEGLNHVWQNNRWEYVDPNDNLVAGYWNDKESKFELTSSVLKGEWRGLFISQSLKEVKSELKEDEKWTIENWENGTIKIPIGFDVSKGGVIEEIKAQGNIVRGLEPCTVMGIKDLPSGTVIFSSFSPGTNRLSIGWSNDGANFDTGKDLISLSFSFRNTSQCLIINNSYPNNPYNGTEYSGQGSPLFLGSPLLKVNNNDVLSKISTLFVNPFLKGNYQVLMSATQEDSRKPINFSFKNLLRDESGRFVTINPSPSEIEKMKSAIEEEAKNVALEAEKKNLEKKIETSSLIKKSETATTIDGLEFDKETGFYFAKETNDYGLKKDTKAGVFKNGLLGLNSEVINSLQLKEIGFQIPLPFNPVDASDLKLVEEKILGKDYLLIRLNKEMAIYSPVNGLCYNGKSNAINGSITDSFQTFNFNLKGIEDFTIFSKEIKYFSHKEKVVIGDKLGEVKQDVFIKIRFENILKIGDVPIFILPNE